MGYFFSEYHKLHTMKCKLVLTHVGGQVMYRKVGRSGHKVTVNGGSFRAKAANGGKNLA